VVVPCLCVVWVELVGPLVVCSREGWEEGGSLALHLRYDGVIGSVPVGWGRRGRGGSVVLLRRFVVVWVGLEPVGCCLVV
jgi:hypothetical protein